MAGRAGMAGSITAGAGGRTSLSVAGYSETNYSETNWKPLLCSPGMTWLSAS